MKGFFRLLRRSIVSDTYVHKGHYSLGFYGKKFFLDRRKNEITGKKFKLIRSKNRKQEFLNRMKEEEIVL